MLYASFIIVGDITSGLILSVVSSKFIELCCFMSIFLWVPPSFSQFEFKDPNLLIRLTSGDSSPVLTNYVFITMLLLFCALRLWCESSFENDLLWLRSPFFISFDRFSSFAAF